MRFNEAVSQWRADRPHFEALGIILPDVQAYATPESKRDYTIAMDAQPAMFTDVNAGVPIMLTTLIDPDVFEIMFAPMNASKVLGGETKRGTWLDDTALFPVAEATGEVSTYGDFNNNGRAGVNTAWPARQAYLFQVIKEYGEREMERAGLARINWVSEIDKSAALTMNKFRNYTYFFGVAGLQNYGLLNDPNLSAALTPSTKAAGGTAWITAGGAINATPNEIYADIEALFYKLVTQTAGLVDQETEMVLALSAAASVALTATNSFNVNVSDLLKKNFPNIRIVTATQYGALTASNPQGVAAGNFVQLAALNIEGQRTGFPAYNELMRSHPVIRHMSSFRQKVSGGTWGTVLRMPAAVAAMVGI
jgi:hypothetical protein